MRAIGFAFVACAIGLACDESIKTPPCLPDCVPQPCEREYPLFWISEPARVLAGLEQVFRDWDCEPPPSGEPSVTLTCRSGGGDEFPAFVEFDEEGRLTAVTFSFSDGACVTEYAFGYDGVHLVHMNRRSNACLDSGPTSESWADVRWEGDHPAEELGVVRVRADPSSEPVALEGDFERFETARRWDGDGRPLWEETLVGAERVFNYRRDLTWSNGVLVRAVTQVNWPSHLGDQPGCDQLGPNWSSCETTFEYEDGVMVSYTESNRTIAISDDCCPYIGCREPGWLPSLP